MLKLHGFSASNYVNMVKFALLEKGMAFEQVNDYPSQEASFLAISPMGKVPVLETDQGFLAETNVILEYIDETGQGQALYPADPFQRAQVKELAKLIELYIELPARRCYPEVFFGGKVSDETKQQAREALIKGAAALKRVAKFDPFVAGAQLTAADAVLLYSLDLAAGIAGKLFDLDLLAEIPGSKALLDQLNQRDSARQVDEERKAGMAEFMAHVRGGK